MGDPFLYERVYDYVLEEIRSENLKAGDRVPSEKELAERFGVSRITSKRALAMLAAAGVVDRRPGRGSFVVDKLPPLEPRDAGHVRGTPAAGDSCLALVLPDASEAYGLDLLCAIEERAAEHGYHLIVRRTRGRQDAEEAAIGALTGAGPAAGLIVFPVHGEFYNASLVRLVLDRWPLVLVDRYLRGIPACAVHTDNVAAARALTDHLLDRGHRRIAFLSPPAENTSSIEDRLLGYESALRERGVPCDVTVRLTHLHSTLPGPTTAEQVAADRTAIQALLAREPDLTGFVVCEYSLALLLQDVLADVDEGPGADRPHRTIACFDSPAQGARPFVHARQDQHAMGRTAVDLLVAQLEGTTVPHRTLVPFTLVDPAAPSPAR